MALRPADSLQPGRVILPRVDEQSNAVTADQRRLGRARERLVSKAADRRQVGALTVLE